MVIKNIVKIIAFVELLIGLSTISGLIISAMLGISTKPLNVFLFVLISAAISSILGLGILNHKEKARTFLVFFSGCIIVTKILILAGLMRFNGEIIAFIPHGLKDFTSIVYHAFIVLFFTRDPVRSQFTKNESRA